MVERQPSKLNVVGSNPITRFLQVFVMSEYDFGGLEKHPVNILRLISELEGSFQLCKYMGFEDDMNTINDIKKKYYKMYFRLKKQETSVLE